MAPPNGFMDKIQEAMGSPNLWGVVVAAFLGGMFSYMGISAQVAADRQANSIEARRVAMDEYARIVAELRQRNEALGEQLRAIKEKVYELQDERQEWVSERYRMMEAQVQLREEVDHLQTSNDTLRQRVNLMRKEMAAAGIKYSPQRQARPPAPRRAAPIYQTTPLLIDVDDLP